MESPPIIISQRIILTYEHLSEVGKTQHQNEIHCYLLLIASHLLKGKPIAKEDINQSLPLLEICFREKEGTSQILFFMENDCFVSHAIHV